MITITYYLNTCRIIEVWHGSEFIKYIEIGSDYIYIE